MGIHNDRPTIGFFAPSVSGFYLSTLCSELRKQCALRRMDLVVILTNETTDFNMPLALDYIDAAYIAVDVLSSIYVEQLLARNIPVVSASEEYFSLAVESVISDQKASVQLAFDHLYDLGHRRIGFVGTLFITDFRLRYQALRECYAQKAMVFNENWLFDVSDPGIVGGANASEKFIAQACDCSAIICGSDMMALGMVNALDKKSVNMPQQLAIVSIDNNPLGESCIPTLTSIDQNLPVMISRVIDRLQGRLSGLPFIKSAQLIAPRIVIRESCGGADEVLLPCANNENEQIQSASYMQDCSNLALAIGGRDYRWMTSLSKLWGPFFTCVCLGKWQSQFNSSRDKERITLVDVIDGDGDCTILDSYINSEIAIQKFPPLPIATYDANEILYVTLIPITPEGIKWGVMTIIDKLDVGMDQASYNMFFYYVSLISVFMQREALTECVRDRERNALNLAKRLEVIAHASNDGIWTWNLELNLMEWNDQLLEMLGFITEEEKLCYRNMSFFERIHSEDQEVTRFAITAHLQKSKPFKLEFRMRAKSGAYLWVTACGEAMREADGRTSRFVGVLTDITEQYHSKQHIEFLAYHDSLTELPNRAALMERVTSDIRQYPDACFAIMLMDLNRFKEINDTFGHAAGDAVLVYVAEAISFTLRKEDHASRFGGDEFVFKIDANTGSEALLIAQRILDSFQGEFSYEGYEIPIAGSIGVSLYPQHATLPEELIDKADTAMYHAKSQSHNKVQLFRSQLVESIVV
ncbi:diguanylate cyclase [Psychromonas sp. MME2]|uniref:diguanylate cyclase domain-containing protein n=1 Tax=Psychromonas sp. MME2 TaxID=3231033 RepID=UPI00339BAC07